MVGLWIGFILATILFGGSIAWIAITEGDQYSFGVGAICIIGFFFAFIFGIVLFADDSQTYENKYKGKIEDVIECRIDTTFTTTNNITDTTYTIFYNCKAMEE